MEQKGRIEWIDTAKGICISFVVLYHISEVYGGKYIGSDVIQAFRMPLYFLLSGLFFKKYDGLFDFTKRKCNKILIPYIFFYVTSSVILPYLIYQISGFCVRGYTSSLGLRGVFGIFSEIYTANPNIWFLVCLFEVNILFYLITIVGKRPLYILFLSLFIGGIGLYISWHNISDTYWKNGKGWYYLDSAFSMLPFFYFGWFLRNKTDFLYWKNSHKNIAISIVLIVFSILMIHYVGNGKCLPIHNYYGNNVWALVELYPYGILGSLSVLSFSRIIKRIPLVSYIGRYSLIVLCTHEYVFQLFAESISHITLNSTIVLWTTFLLSVPTCALIIPFFKKAFPYFTAQKDLIPILSSKGGAGKVA